MANTSTYTFTCSGGVFLYTETLPGALVPHRSESLVLSTLIIVETGDGHLIEARGIDSTTFEPVFITFSDKQTYSNVVVPESSPTQTLILDCGDVVELSEEYKALLDALQACAAAGGSEGNGFTRSTSSSTTITLEDNHTDHVGASDVALTGDLTLSLTDGNSGNVAIVKHSDSVMPTISGATVIPLTSLADNYQTGSINYIHLRQRDVSGGSPEVFLWIAEYPNPEYKSKYYPAKAFEVDTSNTPTDQVISSGDNRYRALTFTVGDRAILKTIMPFDYAGGPVRARAYWSTSGGSASDTVGWEFKGVAIKDDQDLSTAQGTAVTVYDIVTATTDQMISGASTDITIDGTPASGSPVFLEVSLSANSESDAHLHGIEIQYEGKTVNVGIWTPYSDSAPAEAVFLMDGIGGTHYAVYDHKRRYAAASDWGVVRESGGDTDLTVGFGGDGWQNASAITSHIGGNSGFLKEWKDQTTNGYHVSQADNTKQPLLGLTGGVYEGLFDQTDDHLAGAFDVSFAAVLDYYMVIEEDGASNTGVHRQIFSANQTGNAEEHYAKELSGFMSIYGPTQVYTGLGGARLPARSLYTFRFNGASSEIRKNGVVQTPVGGSDVGGSVMVGLTLGATSAKNTNFWSGKILAFIVTSRLLDGDRDAIEAELISDYSIS